MTNKKTYLILYYISFLLTLALHIYTNGYTYYTVFLDNSFALVIFFSIILILFLIIISILFIKKDLKASIIFPLIYIIFTITLYLLIIKYFSDTIYPIYPLYYFKFIIIGFIFLNIYTCLCLTKKEKSQKKKIITKKQ